MRTASCTAAGLSNRVGAETCILSPKKRTPSPLQVAITELIKFKKPKGEKAWAYIAELFDLKERAAKHRLSNTVSYTIEELQALVQGEDGFEFFEAMMADSEPAWWSWAKWVVEQGNLKRLATEAMQKSLLLESQLPAGAPQRRKGSAHVKQLGTELARSQTALGILDSYSGRAVAGAVAKTQEKARNRGVRR